MKLSKQVLIKINNNKCTLICNPKLLFKIREDKLFRIRSKGAWYSQAFHTRKWDGMVRAITEGGVFETGYLPRVVNYLKENKYQIEYEDFRDHFDYIKVKRNLNGSKLRDIQMDAVTATVTNEIDGIPFPRGIIGAATNYGKTITAAGIYKAYGRKSLFLLNSKDLFEQAIKEIPALLPGKVGQVSAGKIVWNDFMICMVQTLNSRLKVIGNKLAEYDIVMVDECDLSTSKSYTTVLNYCYNCYVKVGLSGSPFVHKDPIKNEKVRKIYGDLYYTMKNKELIELGLSAPVKIRILKGNIEVECRGNYEEEYRRGIIESKERNNVIRKRVKHHAKYKRLPCMIFVKNHKHVEILYKKLKKLPYKVEWAHHKREGRSQIVEDFRDGKIDILVTSMILKRGMNFPLLKYICNAAGGDSMGNILQILGRGTRTSATKLKTVLEDFFDEGSYLKRHSKHRIRLYKSEGLEVIEEYK